MHDNNNYIIKGKKIDAERKGDAVGGRKAEDMEILMDSLQVILDLFSDYSRPISDHNWRLFERQKEPILLSK